MRRYKCQIKKSPRSANYRGHGPQGEASWTKQGYTAIRTKTTTRTPARTGLVFLTYTTFDEEVGDEVERIESVPCGRCAISSEEDRLDHDEDMLLA